MPLGTAYEPDQHGQRCPSSVSVLVVSHFHRHHRLWETVCVHHSHDHRAVRPRRTERQVCAIGTFVECILKFYEAYVYPENLNVFNSGTPPTLVLGFTRIVTIVFFGYGFLWAAPSIVFNPEAPTFWAPVVALGSAIPLLATGLLFSNYVHHINLLLPPAARRSKDALLRFVSDVPPSTTIQIKSMMFRPWPHTKEVPFGNLRRLPSSWARLSNLEYVPYATQHLADEHKVWHSLTRNFMGRYFVSRSQITDRSRAPGAWNRMWEQIPMLGEAPVLRPRAERKPVVMANRPRATSRAERSPTVSKR